MSDDTNQDQGNTDNLDGNGDTGNAGGDEGDILNADGGAGAGNDDGDILNAGDQGDEGGTSGGQGDGGEGGKGDDDGDGDDEGNEGAPETYEAFNVPEGVEADEETFETFTAAAKEAGLSQEQAQKFVDTYFEMGKKSAEKLQATIETQSKTWRDEVVADPELGGENFDTTRANVATVAQNIPEFGKVFGLFSDWGVANNPDVVRAFNALGKLFSEDSFKAGNDNGSVSSPAAEKVLYPNMN